MILVARAASGGKRFIRSPCLLVDTFHCLGYAFVYGDDAAQFGKGYPHEVGIPGSNSFLAGGETRKPVADGHDMFLWPYYPKL